MEQSNVFLVKQPLAAIKIMEAVVNRYFLKIAKSKKSRQNQPKLHLQVVGYLYENEINFKIIIIRSHKETL